MNSDRALENLLLSLFSADELRRLIRWLPDGERLLRNLPGANASFANLVAETVALLRQDGMLARPQFWAALAAERPRRKGDIDAVEAQYARGPQGPSSIKVLLVSASPDTHVRVRVDTEFSAIIKRVRGTLERDRIQFVQLQAATFDELRVAMQTHRPHILHISSHGDSEGSLVFEGETEGARKIPKVKLKRLLTALGDNLLLVVINACESAQIARELVPDIGLAIGMSDQVADSAAIQFACVFYESLGFGNSPEKAFAVALVDLEDEDHDIPQLFPPATDDPQKKRTTPLLAP